MATRKVNRRIFVGALRPGNKESSLLARTGRRFSGPRSRPRRTPASPGAPQSHPSANAATKSR